MIRNERHQLGEGWTILFYATSSTGPRSCCTTIQAEVGTCGIGRGISVFRYHRKWFFYRNTKDRKWPGGHLRFFAVFLKACGPEKKRFESLFKATELRVCEFKFVNFFFFLVPSWAFAELFYWIPQFLGKYRYRNTTTARCPIPQYQTLHDLLTTSPTSAIQKAIHIQTSELGTFGIFDFFIQW